MSNIFSILDTPVHYVKLYEFAMHRVPCSRSYTNLFNFTKRDDLTFRTLINLMDDAEVFLPGKVITTGVLGSVILTQASIVLCISINQPERVKYVLCNTIDEGIENAMDLYGIKEENKSSIIINGYFTSGNDETDFRRFLDFLKKVNIKYEVSFFTESQYFEKMKETDGKVKVKPISVRLLQWTKRYDEKPVELFTYTDNDFRYLQFIFDQKTEELVTIQQI